MRVKILAFSILLGVLAGCATTATGPMFAEAPAAQSDFGTFYIFRTFAIASGYPDPMIEIDDRPLTKLQSMGYSYAYVKPGIHKLILRNNMNYFVTEFEIKPGQNLFECLDGYTQSLVEVDPVKARETLRKYRLDSPLNSNF